MLIRRRRQGDDAGSSAQRALAHCRGLIVAQSDDDNDDDEDEDEDEGEDEDEKAEDEDDGL